MGGRQILLVAPIAPPSKLSAARRIAGLTKYLGRRGHEVTVLTSVLSGAGPVPGAARTIRTRDLMVSPLNWRRRNFAKIAGETGGGYDSKPSAAASIVVPDLEVLGWVPFAASKALSICRHQQVDCVITSSPPQSAHLVGLLLGREGVPWVSDFRDGWTFEPLGERFPTSLQRKADEWLERKVVLESDLSVAVTEPISVDLRERFGARVVTIRNAFDPEEQIDEAWEAPLDESRFSFVYTGSFGHGGNSPTSFLNAMEMLAETKPEVAGRVEFVLAGPLTREEIVAIEQARAFVSCRSVGQLTRGQVLKLQRDADALVLFAGDRRPSVATGKIYEYIASGRPILVIGEESDAAKLVEGLAAGEAVAATDVEVIRDAIAEAAMGRLTRSPDSIERIEEYSYPLSAALMEEAVDVAIALSQSQESED